MRDDLRADVGAALEARSTLRSSGRGACSSACTDAGLKYALSNTMRFVAAETSEAGAAHHAGNRLRAIAIGDHEHVGFERAVDAVERHDRLARHGAAHPDLRPRERREIERVHRLADLEVT